MLGWLGGTVTIWSTVFGSQLKIRPCHFGTITTVNPKIVGSGSCLHRRNSYWTWFSKKSCIKTPSVSLDHDFCFLSIYTCRCKVNLSFKSVSAHTGSWSETLCGGLSTCTTGQEMLRSKWMRMPLKKKQSTVQAGNGKCAKWSKNTPIGPRDGTQKLRWHSPTCQRSFMGVANPQRLRLL